MNDARFAREQGRGQNWQRGIFRATHLDRPGERMAAVNENLIHILQKGIASHLNNRFSNKCRGNFFPPSPKEAPRSGRFRSPTPAFLPAEAAMVPVQSVRALLRLLGCWRKLRPPDRAKPRGKECAALVSRHTEDSQQRDRKSPQHFQGDCFSEVAPDRPGLASPHFLARALVHRPRYRRRESAPQEIPQPSSVRSRRCRFRDPKDRKSVV